MRQAFVTKVQLGVQHFDNNVLCDINRGATNEDTIKGMRTLKENGFLTRDSREVERKKPGQPGARKKFQFSKR